MSRDPGHSLDFGSKFPKMVDRSIRPNDLHPPKVTGGPTSVGKRLPGDIMLANFYDLTQQPMVGQSGHRTEDPLVKSSDSDFPEPGQNEEHTGEPENHNQLKDDSGCSPKS